MQAHIFLSSDFVILMKYFQVTWIEHMKYNENLVHDWYRPLINTGVGFGAQRWMATLQRQYQFLKVMKSIIDPIGNHA